LVIAFFLVLALTEVWINPDLENPRGNPGADNSRDDRAV
jgi:hypothetical protein